MVEVSKEKLAELRAEYPVGTRIRLLEMDDQYTKIPIGTLGVVRSVDDTGTIHISWDNGSGLGAVYGVDRIEKVKE